MTFPITRRQESLRRAVAAFQEAAAAVPAYGQLVREAGLDPRAVSTLESFQQVPILDKRSYLARFALHEICRGGSIGQPQSVLTSSGHSGVFAFGLYNSADADEELRKIDDYLDDLIQVRTRRTLLLNCLPMGVTVPTCTCTVGNVSVREDMACSLARQFAPDFHQVLMLGDAVFIKHLLEYGISQGIDWAAMRLHIIVGEEILAENARRYLHTLTGMELDRPEEGMVVSSMGVGELGLNIFKEAPPIQPLIRLRRGLADYPHLRPLLLGSRAGIRVPAVFTYDPDEIFVEFAADGRLIVTMLKPGRQIPMVRYATGDYGSFLTPHGEVNGVLDWLGIDCDELRGLPAVLIDGRGRSLGGPSGSIYPDDVKEAIYQHPHLACKTTANFRLSLDGDGQPLIRIQMSPGVQPAALLGQEFRGVLSQWLEMEDFGVRCEPYEQFGDGMSLDYERKFHYMGS